MESTAQTPKFKIIARFMQTNELFVEGATSREFLSEEDAYKGLNHLESVLHKNGMCLDNIILYHPESESKEGFRFVNKEFLEKSVLSFSVVDFK